MATFRTRADVLDYLQSIPADASPARRWQATRTATRRLLAAYGVPNASKWTVHALPPKTRSTMGRCNPWVREIMYVDWLVESPSEVWELASTIVHEAAHAICETERRPSGRKRHPWHGPMWKGQMAAMGLATTDRFA